MVIKEYNVAVVSSLEDTFGDGLAADDDVTCSFKVEAVRFKRWYYWRHLSNFDKDGHFGTDGPLFLEK